MMKRLQCEQTRFLLPALLSAACAIGVVAQSGERTWNFDGDAEGKPPTKMMTMTTPTTLLAAVLVVVVLLVVPVLVDPAAAARFAFSSSRRLANAGTGPGVSFIGLS